MDRFIGDWYHSELAVLASPNTYKKSGVVGLNKHIKRTHLIRESAPTPTITSIGRDKLTILKPRIMEHQNRTLFNKVRPLTHLLLCTMTIGI